MRAANQAIHLEVAENDEQKIAHNDPYTSLFRDVLLHARNIQASDIHIEPTKEGVDIRLRVFGDLGKPFRTLTREHREGFIRRVKQLCNLKIALSRVPQDGRISFWTWNLIIRVNLFPVLYGEKICLRLLDQNREFSIEKCGLDLKTLKDLRSALNFKNGVILISGPTGSGKTTTLYSLLCEVDRKRKNVTTLEDPIEYELSGINQSQMGASFSFADALRSVVRQDPDVLLVGEVRDKETADLCFKAASTGHLVLSTLHANGAVEVISRLMGLGVDPLLIRSNLRFSGAQRLFGRLCPKCSIPFTPDIELRNGFPLDRDGYRIRENVHPCSCCQEGLVGQIPILEYMLSDEIRKRFETNDFSTQLTTSLGKTALGLAGVGEIDTWEAIHAG